MTRATVLHRYQEELRLQRASWRLLEAHVPVLDAYLRWLGPTRAEDATPETIRAYLRFRRASGDGPASLATARDGLCSLYVSLYGWSPHAFEDRAVVAGPARRS